MTEIVDRLRLPPEPSSAGAARRFVANTIGDGDEVTELAVLLVSELASNAIMHARTEFEVSVHVCDEHFRVAVSDSDPTVPLVRSYSPDALSGRGMHIVAATANRWGYESLPDGKIVWFELDR